MSFAVALAVAFGGRGLALPAAHAEGASGAVISLHVGETADVSQQDMNRVAVADPSIVDVDGPPVGSHLVIHAYSPGKTTLRVWGKDNHRVEYVIEVTK